MQSKFLDAFDGRQVGWADGRATWATLARLRYQSARLRATVEVPATFVTDLASVPRAPLAFWVAGGRGTRSAVLHDFPYQFGYWPLARGGRRVVDKAEADAVLLESLLADPISGAGPVVARVMYWAVRAGGRGCWRDLGARAAMLNPEWTAEGWLAP